MAEPVSGSHERGALARHGDREVDAVHSSAKRDRLGMRWLIGQDTIAHIS
jgi:hypothetical protein